LVLEMHGLEDEEHVFRFLETELPPLFGSLAATVLKTERRGGDTYLVPAVLDTVVNGLGPGSTESAENCSYKLGEGLTGWVGKYQLCLRIERCDREKDLIAAFQRALQSNGGLVNGPVEQPIWLGKTRAAAEAGARRVRNGPVMICPAVDSRKRLRAVVRLCEYESKQFSNADEKFLKDICEQAAICLDNVSRRRELAQRETAAVITQYTHDFGRDVRATREYVQQGLCSARQPGNAIEAVNSLEKAIMAISHLEDSLGDIMARCHGSEPGAIGRRSRFSVVALVSEEIEVKRSLFQRQGISLRCEVHCTDRDVFITTDRALFLRCMGNILTNSSLAISKAGGGKGEINVQVIQTVGDNALGIRFVDSGPGFEEDVLALINQGSAPPSDKRFGNGVALLQCRCFVEDILEGEFQVSNVCDGGACVEWTIPLDTIGVEDERSHAERPT